MKASIFILTCLLLALPCAADIIVVDEDGQRPLVEGPAGTTPAEYAPNQIIVKFRRDIAETIEMGLAKDMSASELKLSDSLDKLNEKYKLKNAKPLFKNFKKRRREVKELLEKDEALLSKKEKHILRRLKRAPKNAKVPELDRIYKLEVELEEAQSLQAAVAAYNRAPEVEYAELNYVVSINLTPNDPLYSEQWALPNIHAPEAWDRATGVSDIVVAVIDTGVDYTHRDLDENMWVNQAELNGTAGVDDDGNGYVDDIYGYDFCTYGQERDANPKDDHGHGTHCSGIIAAEGNNGLDVAGLCWDASIMAIKFLSSGGRGWEEDAAASIIYAVDNGADITSNSYGSDESLELLLEDAINYAHSQGVVMVAAAGNQGTREPHWPAYFENMISVAATDPCDSRTLFSTYGDWVDIAAPGVDILSLYKDGGIAGKSGTSMACPHVAGVCALMLSIYPHINIEDVKQILMESTDPVRPEDTCASGRVNAFKAVVNVLRGRGRISLDREVYISSDLIGIDLYDSDLKGNVTQEITVESDGGDFETVVLIETSTPGIFTRSISISLEPPNVEDGMLQLSHGDIITATYDDANDGWGNPAVAFDTAIADFQNPVISDVRVGVPGRQPRIFFETDEPTTARVLCGLSCGGPYTIIRFEATLKTSHSIKLTGVSPATDYYFVVEAVDGVGHQTVDDNGGVCYAFTTTGFMSAIHVPSQSPTIKEAVENAWDGRMGGELDS